jgi:multidrug efflux pump subunit AcrA (membrane-fusion protein)
VNQVPANQPFVFQPAAATAVAEEPMIGAARGYSQDKLVHETRREITEIIREIASATRSDRTIGQFSSLLVDRMLNVMSAEGVVIWHRESEDIESAFVPFRRCGHITDQSIPNESLATHRFMLSEVAREGAPVVVPATPGASDTATPANPTDVPAAVVPIESDPSTDRIDYLLEVFLEPEGGMTTQRGYLRFVVQMADLAGEFLRSAELRRLKRSTIVGQRVDLAISNLHRHQRPDQVQATIVDTAAEVFDLDRVALCILDAPHSKLTAVSHVNKIDHRSDGAKYLLSVAETELADGIGVIVEDADTSGTIVVGPTDTDSPLRLVAICDADRTLEDKLQLRRYVDHAAVSLRIATQFDAIPGGRFLAALAPALQTGQLKWWLRPIFTACVLTMLMIVAMIPVPLYVNTSATIRPADVQRLTAPRDAIVDQLHVTHGQAVFPGEPLATLRDPDLDKQITKLLGRRSVLIEKRSRGKKLMMGATAGDRDQAMQVHGEQSLTEEELSAVEQELAQLQRIQANLVIRADRSGSVDGWRMIERLEGRPLMRGDPLMKIVATDSPWVVDVVVPQNRIAHIRQAMTDNDLTVQVSLESKPHQRTNATLQAIGPATVQHDTGMRASSVRLRIANQAMASLIDVGPNQNRSEDSWVSDAPAKAVFHCGHQPAVFVLFQDVFAAIRSTSGLYLGSSEASDGP